MVVLKFIGVITLVAVVVIVIGLILYFTTDHSGIED